MLLARSLNWFTDTLMVAWNASARLSSLSKNAGAIPRFPLSIQGKFTRHGKPARARSQPSCKRVHLLLLVPLCHPATREVSILKLSAALVLLTFLQNPEILGKEALMRSTLAREVLSKHTVTNFQGTGIARAVALLASKKSSAAMCRKDIPLLLSAEGKTGKTCTFCLGIAMVIFLFCFVIFLILYVQEHHEKTLARQTLESKSRERDALWIQLLSSNKTLRHTEHLLEMKKKESEDLKISLAITKQTLGKKIQLLEEAEQKRARLEEQLEIAKHNLTTIQGHWNSCQAELHIMEENITSFVAAINKQAAEEQKLKGIIEQLLEQLTSKTKQLADAKREFQQERNKFDRYRQEVSKQAEENQIPCNKGILSDFNMAFLLFIFGEPLFFL